MIVRDVWWTHPVNTLLIECQCGAHFAWPSRISLAQCPTCFAQEYWHDFNDADTAQFAVATVDLHTS